MDSSEQHRHRCEVRAVLRWRVTEGSDWVKAWLDDLPAWRSKAAAEQLRADVLEQWRLGNRGEPGDWR